MDRDARSPRSTPVDRRRWGKLPTGCQVRRAWLTGHDLHLDMRAGWDAVAGTAATTRLAWQLRLTFGQWPSVQRVFFSTDGQPQAAFTAEGNGLPLYVQTDRPRWLKVQPAPAREQEPAPATRPG